MSKLRHAARLGRELWQFAKENEAYWILPLAVLLGLMLLFAFAGQSTPYIYTLF